MMQFRHEEDMRSSGQTDRERDQGEGLAEDYPFDLVYDRQFYP